MAYIKDSTKEAIETTRAELKRRLDMCDDLLENGLNFREANEKYGASHMNSVRNWIVPGGRYDLPKIHIANVEECYEIIDTLKSGAEHLYDAVFALELHGKVNSYAVYQYPDDLEETVDYILSDDAFTEREKQIYELRFCDGKTLRETGEALGITHERVRQCETSLVKKCRKPQFAAILALGKHDTDALAACKAAKKRVDAAKSAVARAETDAAFYNRELSTLPDPDCCDIEMLDLSYRANNALRRNGIKTIAQLKQMDVQSLYHMRNVGKTTANEILSVLEAYDGTVLPLVADAHSDEIAAGTEPVEECQTLHVYGQAEINGAGGQRWS